MRFYWSLLWGLYSLIFIDEFIITSLQTLVIPLIFGSNLHTQHLIDYFGMEDLVKFISSIRYIFTGQITGENYNFILSWKFFTFHYLSWLLLCSCVVVFCLQFIHLRLSGGGSEHTGIFFVFSHRYIILMIYFFSSHS